MALNGLGLPRQVPVSMAGWVEESLRVRLTIKVNCDAVIVGQGIGNLDVFLTWEVVGGCINAGG